MLNPTSSPPAFVLFISEPAAGARRAIQVRGLPFTLGASPEAAVRLRGDESTLARVEEGPGGLRVVDVAGDGLHCDGLLAVELPLCHGSTFELGNARVRFLVGTRESLRPPREPARSAPPPAALEHLRRLEGLEVRLGELQRGLGKRTRRAAARSRNRV